MGLDGFSMGNLGLHTEKTSAQNANNAKRLAQRGTEFSIKTVDELSAKQTSIKGEDQDTNEYEGGSYFLEEHNQSSEGGENDDDADYSLDETKKYVVKLNPITQLVELIDSESNSVIETIAPNDLIKLVYKLNSASGILVNKKI